MRYEPGMYPKPAWLELKLTFHDASLSVENGFIYFRLFFPIVGNVPVVGEPFEWRLFPPAFCTKCATTMTTYVDSHKRYTLVPFLSAPETPVTRFL